ncbi:cyclin-dependent kinase regulatory subunit [Desarmillaria tabescens]|uniref:Cyclin-dependent kinases regulatory subunit n=1 Tax=Armillaria tabescens TaxID=1929756 RepID=A0AA39NDM5_ARMTA|nr:cyclin-dependent kinase regulatory subunit [Desarmillaria tabescens]KAK0463720.1 cyclin-dependent kinase regulatory subunit [Desarmillaria tabescens]
MSSQQLSAEELAKKQAEKIEEIINSIHYSDKYSDDIYEYRHVILPKQLFKMKIIPENYWNADQSALRLLSEKEWRNIGITQSLGWEHYEIHAPEPHILLFRRPKDFVAPTQPAQRRAKDAARRK